MTMASPRSHSPFLACVILLSAVVFLSTPTYAAVASPEPFDINQTYRQLMYAYASYCPINQLSSWSCFFCTYNTSLTQGFQFWSFLENSTQNVFGYVGYQGSTVQVAFRGTQADSLINWIDDLDAATTSPYPDVANAFVHRGFFDAYTTVQTEVLSLVTALAGKIQATQIMVTGHSLGAAIATLCAADLANNFKIPVTMYNFGSPRVGNSLFVQYLDMLVPTIYRVVNQADLVPHLPPKLISFYHTPREVWWQTSTKYILCDPTNGEDPNCSDSVTMPLNILDHLHYLGIRLGGPSGCS